MTEFEDDSITVNLIYDHQAFKSDETKDQELRRWAVEQGVKWRASTHNTRSTTDEMVNAFYAYAKNGGELKFE